MKLVSFPDRTSRILFWAALAGCLVFAAITQHVWEDYWITFRSSKNLATGHGLVFTPGERLHTFTSPLGVLLPALCSFLVGNQSDAVALWLYRILSSAAFATGVVFLWRTSRRLEWPLLVGLGLAAALALDVKTIDFTINGMETGLLIGFLGYTIWASLPGPTRSWRHVGCAWAGLMWTRPDAFLSIGLFSLGLLLFSDERDGGTSRRDWIVTALKAGLLCTLLYLPWFLFAWAYYGSPVPHTITAKSGVSPSELATWSTALPALVGLPAEIGQGTSSFDGVLLPSYVQLGGWPQPLILLGRGIALIAALLWMLPWLAAPARAASLTFCGLHLYLSLGVYFPFPWYQPGPLVFGWMALAGFFAAMLTRATLKPARIALIALAVGWLGTEAWLTWHAGRQIVHEQRLTANATRRALGEWLHDNAEPDDTVFMEPLGHIGYFSGLETLDFPGLSSQTVTNAVSALGPDWGPLIDYLSPEWLALRPFEVDRIDAAYPMLMSGKYEVAREFDHSAEVANLPNLYGRPYLAHDAHFVLFKRKLGSRRGIDLSDPATMKNFPLTALDIDGTQMRLLHAPGIVSFKLPPHTNYIEFTFGFPEAAYSGSTKTSGAEFEALWKVGPESASFFKIGLMPASHPENRGLQHFKAGLPILEDGAELILITRPGENTTNDWSAWGLPFFIPFAR